ncbi:unnamed protein product [Pseudo-nitzschia multistriata]|uniref:Thioredoxin domain-containing protein n=1 Tax=Pseudo-nitzschia multistriata TaxID=183589 RepID=A0A448Z379_9STRA|nr:unnamed protein product [Pseudo-nitzschia multistriata]
MLYYALRLLPLVPEIASHILANCKHDKTAHSTKKSERNQIPNTMLSCSNHQNFVEIATENELTDFLNKYETDGCVVTFSATWCGPCKACKPQLKGEISRKSPIPIGYVYEEDLDPSFLDVFVEIKAFPTFVFFRNGREVARVEGTNLGAVEAMIHSQGHRKH